MEVVYHNVQKLKEFNKSWFLTEVGIFQKTKLRQKNPYSGNDKQEIKVLSLFNHIVWQTV